MIDGLKPYDSRRDSGVSWLGAVPKHWRIEPGFATYREKQQKNTGLVEKRVLSLSYGRIIIKPEEKLRGLVSESFETYQVVNPGDIIIRATDLQNDHTSLRVGLVRDRGIITCAYICLKPTGLLDSGYLHAQLHALDTMKVFYGMGSGLRQNLSFSDFKRMPALVPPKDEQAAIVRFLSHANGNVERAIRAKKKLIALLNEQKQAIIRQTVTHGLNPMVRLKPSGVPWLGDMPKHWDCRRMKFLVRAVGGMTPSKANKSFWSGSVPWVSPKDMKLAKITDSQDHISEGALTRTNIPLVPPPAVLIVVRGMILARKFPVAETTVPVTINQDMKALVPCAELNARFLVHLLTGIQSELLRLVGEAGHGTRCLRTESWSNFIVPVPPISEQKDISRYLETALRAADSGLEQTNSEIDLLREFRTRLIADVVTGKLDVREAAKNLPDEPVEAEPVPVDIEEEAAEGAEEAV